MAFLEKLKRNGGTLDKVIYMKRGLKKQKS